MSESEPTPEGEPTREAEGERGRDRPRWTGRDLLRVLDGEACPVPDCDGELERAWYKGTEGVVCPGCGTPAVRLWGET